MQEFARAADFETRAGIDTSGNAHATAGLMLAVRAQGWAFQGSARIARGIQAAGQTICALQKAFFTARITGPIRAASSPPRRHALVDTVLDSHGKFARQR